MKRQEINRWDSLLAWLSQKDSYAHASVKTASKQLSLLAGINHELAPLGHFNYWAKPLIVLGHAEFDPNSGCVSAIAPGLLKCENPRKALLYGHWGPRLKELSRLSNLSVRIHCPLRGPTCYSISGVNIDYDNIASQFPIWIAEDCSLDLLRRLPNVSLAMEQISRSEVAVEGSWDTLHYFSNYRLRWRPAETPLSDAGLYRRRSGKTIFVHVDLNGRCHTLKTKEEVTIAQWYHSPRADWLYDPGPGNLFIPFGFPELPILVSRGLTMNSARLPTIKRFERRRWQCFVTVGEQQALEAARIMEQELKIRNLTDAKKLHQ